MLDVETYIKDALFFEGPESLYRKLTPGETFLGSDMFSRVFEDKVIVHYLNSSDQIEIPREYLNFFQILNTRVGERFKGNLELLDDLEIYVSLGIDLPGIFLHNVDPRGIRYTLSRMILIGTSKIREIISDLPPWILRNVRNTIEI